MRVERERKKRERGHQHKAITQKAGVSTTNVKENFVRCAEKIYAFTSSIEHSAFLQWKNSNIQYPLNCHIFYFTNINKPIIICERRLSFILQSLTQNVSIPISLLCQLYVVQVTIVTLLLKNYSTLRPIDKLLPQISNNCSTLLYIKISELYKVYIKNSIDKY